MSLGTLGTLPEEVRRLIWKDFIVPLFHTIREETGHSRKQQADTLRGDGRARTRTQPPCFIRPLSDQERIIVGNLPHLTLDDFRHTDFSIFKTITVTIYPPDVTDPGQFVRVRSFVLRRVALLRRSKILPDIEIYPRETGSALWYTNGVANNSLAGLTFSRYFDGSDIEGVLAPFQTLRRTGRKRVCLPPAAETSESVLQVVSCIETATLHPLALGDDCSRHVDIGTIFLDIELDRLAGPTASIVRWERFRNWNEFYPVMQETADRVTSYLRGVYGDVRVHSMELSSDYDWFSDFRLPPFPDNPTWSPEDPWRWHYYFDGIPAKDTLEWDYAVEGRELYLTDEEEDRRLARMDHYMASLENGWDYAT